MKLNVAALLAGLLIASQAEAAPASESQGDQGKARKADAVLPFPHLVYGPEKVEAGKRLPLVIYLHGGGERGTDFDALRRHGPPLLLADGVFPRPPKDFYLVAPQCQADCRGWPVREVRKFLDGFASRYAIDPERVTVTGQSMGGIGTIALLADSPSRFAGGVALCGRGDEGLARRVVDVPLWMIHGADDYVIPVSGSRQMYKWITAAGGKKVRYDELPSTGHMIHNDTYKRAAIWDWLLAQRRAGASP